MTPPAAAPRVVYATFPTSRRSGGVHVMMQHVRLLRTAGRQAWLWLPGPPPAWFDDDLPLLIGPAQPLDADDILVLPEVPVVPGRDPAPGARKVILNQNHFYTYAAGGPPESSGPQWSYPGWSPASPSVWTVSRESADVLRALAPNLDVALIPNFVDTDLFTPRPGPPSVAWFTRKRPLEASLVHRLLDTDARLAGVELHPIAGQDRATVADLLGRARVFIAFGHTEGFGLPVAEALAAGCLVTGYDGGGGHELFDAPGAWPVAEQRPLLLVDRVAKLVRRHDVDTLGDANRAWLRERYNEQRTVAALLAAVDLAQAGPGAAAVATHPAGWLDRLAPDFHLTG